MDVSNMMPNHWKEILMERGFKQSEFAAKVGINKGTFSRVCSGQQLLPWDDLELCLLHLGCKAQEVYPASVLAFYGVKPQRKPAKKRTAKRIPMDEGVAAKVDALVESGSFKNRAEAVELIVKKYLEENTNAV